MIFGIKPFILVVALHEQAQKQTSRKFLFVHFHNGIQWWWEAFAVKKGNFEVLENIFQVEENDTRKILQSYLSPLIGITFEIIFFTKV